MLFHCCIATQTQNSNSRSLAWPSRSHITSTELQQNKQKRRKAATATKLDPAQRSHPHHRIPVAKRRGLALGWPNRRCVCERRPLFFSWHSNLHSYMCNGEGFGGFREHLPPARSYGGTPCAELDLGKLMCLSTVVLYSFLNFSVITSKFWIATTQKTYTTLRYYYWVHMGS